MTANLTKYAQHLHLCAALATDGPYAPYPCSCGLDETLNDATKEYPYGTVGYAIDRLKGHDPNKRLIFATSPFSNLEILSVYEQRESEGAAVCIDLGEETE